MAIEPSSSPIKIATLDEDLGNRAGIPNKVPVRATVINSGWGFEQQIAANELNQLLNNHGQWLEYVAEQVPANRNNIAILDTSLQFTNARSLTNYQTLLNFGERILANEIDINQNKEDITALTLRVEQLESDVQGLQLPIGTVMEMNVATNPTTLLGYGTWVAFAQGRVTVGFGATTDDRGETIDFSSIGESSEAGEFRHVLTESELAEHDHRVYGSTASFANTDPVQGNSLAGELNGSPLYTNSGTVGNKIIEDSGSGSPHNNMQPYVVVYKWVRTA